MSKTLKTRIVHKHETEAKWNLAVNFIPMKAELIVYDPDDNYNYARFKIGDGETKVNDLPFVDEASKEYTDEAITNVIRQLENSGLTREIVEQLPPITDAKENIIYMVPNDNDTADNIYNEYMIISSVYELIGSTAVDLAPYATKEELGSYATTQYVSGEVSSLNQRQDELNSKVAQIPGEISENGEIFNLYEDTETDIGSIAGISFGKQTLPKNAAIGEYSHSEGISTTAAGKGSHAEGAGVFVSGSSAHGEGLGSSYNVKVTKIEGNIITIESTNSNPLLRPSELEAIEKNAILWYETNAETHEGKFYYVTNVELVKNFLQITTSSKLTLNTTPAFAVNAQLKVILGAAFGSMSHVEGGFSATLDPDLTKLYGVDATTKKLQHAEGAHNLAIGFASHVEGQYSVALGSHSHAQGLNTSAEGIAASTSGQNTRATGDCSHAGGRGAVAQGGDSLAYGYNTQANGYASVAVGSGAKAIGDYSFAGGQSSEANNNHSFAFGLAVRTNEDTQAQFAVGKFNSSVPNALFVVGNGASDGAKSNAFVVMEDGSATIKTMGEADDSVATKAYVDSKNHVIVGPGGNTGSASADYSVAIMGTASANGATAIGYYSKAEGFSSFAGPEATAKGAHSVAFGMSMAEGYGDFAAGTDSTAKGGASVALGNQTIASAYGSMAVGNSSQALGDYSFAGGRSAWAGSDYSFAYGLDTYTDENTPAQFTVGKFNARAQDALFVVGNGESASTRANAFVVMKDGSATIKTMGTTDNSVATKKYVDDHTVDLSGKMDKFGDIAVAEQDFTMVVAPTNLELRSDIGITLASGINSVYVSDSAVGLFSDNNVNITGLKINIGQTYSDPIVPSVNIHNVVTPTEDTDAVNKKYVDDFINNIDISNKQDKFVEVGHDVYGNIMLSSSGTMSFYGGNLSANIYDGNGMTCFGVGNGMYIVSDAGSITLDIGNNEIANAKINMSFGTVNISADSGVKIHNIVDPVDDGDAISKKYVEENYVSREEYNKLLDTIISIQEQLIANNSNLSS